MKKIICFLSIVLSSCSSSVIQTASVRSSSLVASAEDCVLGTARKLTPNDEHRLQRYYPKTYEKLEEQETLNAQDIVNMTRAGIADEVILYEIQGTKSTFFLTPEDERDLQQSGVSRKVIAAMKETIDDSY